MKIGGLGEFENIRKAMQKEDARKAPPTPQATSGESVDREDAVQISGQAKMLGKLRQIPDVRQAEIDRVLQKANDGKLMTPEAIKESVAKMVENLIGGNEDA